MTTTLKRNTVSLPTGVRLRYAEAGPRTGPAVLLLHGYSDSSFSFAPILPRLDPGLRLIVPDQRGHGDSDRPQVGYAPADLAADAVALLQELDIDCSSIVGHSMGSFVAQQILAMAPERVLSMVLVGSAVRANNDIVQSLMPEVQGLTDPMDRAFVRSFQLSTIHRRLQSDFLDAVVLESLKLPARVWRVVLEGMLAMPPLPHAPSIPCPVSLFWGNRDTIFTRADQHELLQRLPGATLEVFTDVGHALHWEAPAEFASRLMNALHRV